MDNDKQWEQHIEFLRTGYNSLKIMCELQQIEIAGLKQQCKSYENDADYYRSLCVEISEESWHS